jgi:probable O-glycosylation ligase (exosortase A-associated)
VLGLAVYAWLAYMRPQDLAWNISSMQLSLWVAIAMLVGLVLASGRERFATFRLQTILLIAIGVWYAITCQTAVLPDLAEKWLDVYVKIILISVITTGLVITRRRFDFMMMVIAFSLGLLGMKNGLFAISAGGAQFTSGPGGFMIDRNAFAVALNMAIPLLVGVALTTDRKLLRIAALALVPFCMITIFCTFSRGGLLTLGLVGAMLIWRTRKPVLATVVLAAGIAAFSLTTSDQLKEKYADRSSSITSFEEDESAMGRIRAWGVALQMWSDHPITGVGPRNFTLLYRRYSNTDEVHVAHNSYLQMLAETGLPGFLLFVSLLAVGLLRLQVVRMRHKDGWAGIWAGMMQVSLVAFAAGGLLLDMALFDLFYQMVALTVSLEVAAAGEAVEPGAEPAVRTDGPWWKQPRAAAAGGGR